MTQPATPQQDGVFGFWRPQTSNSDYNQLHYIIQSMINNINVATIVKVVAVYTEGRAGATGTVDIVPMVNMVDGAGASWEHTTVFNVPYFRAQGGASAIICDPRVGDIGFAVFCDSDISSVIATSKAAPPNSARKFNYSDALYFGGWGAKVSPENYILVDDAGVEITATEINLNGIVKISTGATGAFTSSSGQTITVLNGVVIGIT